MTEISRVSLEQMADFVGEIVKRMKPGMILGLVGDLGAGKTTFTQLIAKHFGVDERVNSPTFNLQKVYELPKAYNNISRLIHVDAYRLKSTMELEDIGFFELLNDGKAVAVIEWANQLPELENFTDYLPIEFVDIQSPAFREIKLPTGLY